MPALDDAGFRAVAPYLRGYAPSDVPADGCVQTGASVLDVIGLHEHFGGDGRAVLIGHDWGASIVYGAANHAPERWAKVVGMAVPPGRRSATAFLTNHDQLKRSWYMFFFQHALADLVVPADDLAFIDMIWADWSPGYDAADDLVAAKAAPGDPAHLAAAIGYYRAALGGVGTRPSSTTCRPRPTSCRSSRRCISTAPTDGGIGAEVAELGPHRRRRQRHDRDASTASGTSSTSKHPTPSTTNPGVPRMSPTRRLHCCPTGIVVVVKRGVRDLPDGRPRAAAARRAVER